MSCYVFLAQSELDGVWLQLSLCVFLPATVVKRCGRNLSQSPHMTRTSPERQGRSFFVLFSFQRRCEVAFREGGGAGGQGGW